MSVKVLLVDEASSVRSMFSRLLQSLDCETVEAPDGGAALELLDKEQFDFAIFDMDTPLLSGIELLQAVRTSSRYSMLPVVMITDGAAEERVAEAVRHGASECLTRPFDSEKIRVRLEHLIKIAQKRSGGSGTATTGVQPSLLIVDRNAEFRHFVANVLTSTYSTMQVEEGVQALRMCVRCRPSVVVLGDDTGALAPHQLARRLKRSRTLARTRIVLVRPRDVGGDALDPTAFDAILTRTFVPAEFALQFEQAIAQSATGTGDLEDLRRSVISATEQVVGMMAGTSVELSEDGSAPLPEPELEAFTVITLQVQGTAVRLALKCDLLTARRLLAQMTGLQESEIAAEDARSGLGEIVNVISGRVKGTVTRTGGSASYTIPETRSIGPEAAAAASDITLHFVSSHHQLSLRMVLTALDADAPAPTPVLAAASAAAGPD